MDGQTVSIATVTSRFEADLIVGLLQSNGIWANVTADDVGGQEPQLQLEGVYIVVAKADEATARQVLAEAEADAGQVDEPDQLADDATR